MLWEGEQSRRALLADPVVRYDLVKAPLLLLSFALALSGCSAPGITTGTGRPALPFPGDYEARIGSAFLSVRERAEVTTPRQFNARNVTSKDEWLVCLRRADGTITTVFLGKLGIDGKIKGAEPYCTGRLDFHAMVG